jgi:predicted short-subunit dehydrogenase-like oxidoreductase (DUF2520 family)
LITNTKDKSLFFFSKIRVGYFYSMISIVLLGAGNVGQHLFEAIKNSKDLQLIQWYNRSLSRIKPFENFVPITDDITALKPAQLYIITVSDDAIRPLSESLNIEQGLVVHTSGTASIHDLSKKLSRGVLYPLQSFTLGKQIDFSRVPICLEALDKKYYTLLEEVAMALGSPYYKINTEQRKVLHLSAVFINNFGNHLFRIAHEISDAKSINFDILKPLIMETAEKVQEMSPYRAQTGPALRGDKKTIKRHLKLLDESSHKAIYEMLTQSIQKTHGR